MSYSWNTMNRKEVLTHWSPVPSSGALWEGGRISVQYLQWPFPLTGEGPMGKNWRRQTMNNRVQGWAMVPAQHVPLRNVDYGRVKGSQQGSRNKHGSLRGTPVTPARRKITCSPSRYDNTFNALAFYQMINKTLFSFTLNTGLRINMQQQLVPA